MTSSTLHLPWSEHHAAGWGPSADHVVSQLARLWVFRLSWWILNLCVCLGVHCKYNKSHNVIIHDARFQLVTLFGCGSCERYIIHILRGQYMYWLHVVIIWIPFEPLANTQWDENGWCRNGKHCCETCRWRRLFSFKLTAHFQPANHRSHLHEGPPQWKAVGGAASPSDGQQ